MGIVSPDSMAQKRPYIIVGAFAVGMLMTPPDIFSQTLLAFPVWILFEIGLWFSGASFRATVTSCSLNWINRKLVVERVRNGC